MSYRGKDSIMTADLDPLSAALLRALSRYGDEVHEMDAPYVAAEFGEVRIDGCFDLAVLGRLLQEEMLKNG